MSMQTFMAMYGHRMRPTKLSLQQQQQQSVGGSSQGPLSEAAVGGEGCCEESVTDCLSVATAAAAVGGAAQVATEASPGTASAALDFVGVRHSISSSALLCSSVRPESNSNPATGEGLHSRSSTKQIRNLKFILEGNYVRQSPELCGRPHVR